MYLSRDLDLIRSNNEDNRTVGSVQQFGPTFVQSLELCLILKLIEPITCMILSLDVMLVKKITQL